MAIVFTSLAFAQSPASACSCSVPTPEELFENADAVFEGTVARVETHFLKCGLATLKAFGAKMLGRDVSAPVLVCQVEVVFDVDVAWKGVEPGFETVYTGRGGGDCGLPFTPGVAYRVYAYRDSGLSKPAYFTGLCSGTAPAGVAREVLGPLGIPARRKPDEDWVP